jgi:hypothetical protein
VKLATLWFRKTEDRFEFNHLEDGHCLNDVPTPKCEAHKRAWSGKWKKELVQLTDTFPAKVITNKGATNESTS